MQKLLKISLKEWAAICRALETGDQIILIRKGGIAERGGQFELSHREFALFPTRFHENENLIKPQFAHFDKLRPGDDAGKITFRIFADVTDVLQLRDRASMDRIDDQHIWTAAQIDARFNYRPQNPLYLLLLRVLKLDRPITISNSPAYDGCKSWVPLDDPIDISDARNVLDDAQYQSRRQAILSRIG